MVDNATLPAGAGDFPEPWPCCLAGLPQSFKATFLFAYDANSEAAALQLGPCVLKKLIAEFGIQNAPFPLEKISLYLLSPSRALRIIV